MCRILYAEHLFANVAAKINLPANLVFMQNISKTTTIWWTLERRRIKEIVTPNSRLGMNRTCRGRPKPRGYLDGKRSIDEPRSDGHLRS